MMVNRTGYEPKEMWEMVGQKQRTDGTPTQGQSEIEREVARLVQAAAEVRKSMTVLEESLAAVLDQREGPASSEGLAQKNQAEEQPASLLGSNLRSLSRELQEIGAQVRELKARLQL
jgi:hypothetical protein